MRHFSSNIPSTVFLVCIFFELLCTARCTIRTKDFIPSASDLILRMIAQSINRATLNKQL